MVKEKIRNMDKREIKITIDMLFILGTFILGIILGIYLENSFSKCENSLDNFAKCITDRGLIMYGRNDCAWCQFQKQEFGNSFQFIKYIDCNENKDECLTAKINGTPTWIYNEKSYENMLTIGQLRQITGCDVK